MRPVAGDGGAHRQVWGGGRYAARAWARSCSAPSRLSAAQMKPALWQKRRRSPGDGGEVGAVESTPCGGEVFAVSELSEVGSDCLYGPVPGCSWVDGVEKFRLFSGYCTVRDVSLKDDVAAVRACRILCGEVLLGSDDGAVFGPETVEDSSGELNGTSELSVEVFILGDGVEQTKVFRQVKRSNFVVGEGVKILAVVHSVDSSDESGVNFLPNVVIVAPGAPVILPQQPKC